MKQDSQWREKGSQRYQTKNSQNGPNLFLPSSSTGSLWTLMTLTHWLNFELHSLSKNTQASDQLATLLALWLWLDWEKEKTAMEEALAKKIRSGHRVSATWMVKSTKWLLLLGWTHLDVNILLQLKHSLVSTLKKFEGEILEWLKMKQMTGLSKQMPIGREFMQRQWTLTSTAEPQTETKPVQCQPENTQMLLPESDCPS